MLSEVVGHFVCIVLFPVEFSKHRSHSFVHRSDTVEQPRVPGTVLHAGAVAVRGG